MDTFKTYLVEVVWKKYGPSLVKGAIAAFMGYLASHAGILESWGITSGVWPLSWPSGSEPSGHVILIELDTISAAKITAIGGFVMATFTAIQHHTVAAVKGTPQSGDLRVEPNQPIPNGERSTDPKPKET